MTKRQLLAVELHAAEVVAARAVGRQTGDVRGFPHMTVVEARGWTVGYFDALERGYLAPPCRMTRAALAGWLVALTEFGDGN